MRMSGKALTVSCVFMMLVCLAGSANGIELLQQKVLRPTSISTVTVSAFTISPGTTTLIPGGASVTVEAKGPSLDKVQQVSVSNPSDGSSVPGIQASLDRSKLPTALYIQITATSLASPGGPYKLSVFGINAVLIGAIPLEKFSLTIVPRKFVAVQAATALPAAGVTSSAATVSAVSISSVDVTPTGFALNGAGFLGTGTSPPPTQVFDGNIEVTNKVTEKSGNRLVVSNWPLAPPGMHTFRVKVGTREATYSYDLKALTVTAVNQTAVNSYEIVGSGFGTNPGSISVEEYNVGLNTISVVPTQYVTLVSDTRVTVSRLPSDSYGNEFTVTMKIGNQSGGRRILFYYKPEITGITFTDQGWEVHGAHLPGGITAGIVNYLIDGQYSTFNSSVYLLDMNKEKLTVKAYLSAGNHTHQFVTTFPEPYKASNNYTASHPNPPVASYSGFQLGNSLAVSASNYNGFAVSLVGSLVPVTLGPALSFRLVESGKMLERTLNASSSGIIDKASLQIPPDASLGLSTLEASIYSYSTSSKIYVLPIPLPTITGIIGGVRSSTGEQYVKPGDSLTINTSGRFDYARILLGGMGDTTVRRGASGEIVYQVPSFNTVEPIWGNKALQVSLCLDSIPPPNSGINPCVANFNPAKTVFYANVPILSAAKTPGTPVIDGMTNVVFPNVDFVIDGKDLVVPGLNTVVSIGAETLLTQPGSTDKQLLVRIPSSSASTGGLLSVNNGMLVSRGPAYVYGSNVDVQVVRPVIQSLNPQFVKAGSGPYRVTVSGKYLGFLATGVSLNGAAASIVTRYDQGMDIEFPNGIQTGDIVVQTVAGNALPVTTGGSRLFVNP